MLTWRRILIGLGVLAVIGGAGAYYVLSHGPGNVSNPDVAFEEETPTPTATPKGTEKKAKPEFLWTTYGYTPDRRRAIDVPDELLRPPFKRRWTHKGHVLLEFPPSLSAKSLFLLKDDGVVESIDKEDGSVHWRRDVGNLAASTPHLDVARERLYVTVLSPGRIMALSTKRGAHGKTLWSRDLGARTESSPVESDGWVYFGAEDGRVYSLNAKTGKPRWIYRAAGPVKGALAFKDGRLYFGDYAGKVYCLDAATGKRVWEASTKGARFGFASGRFYGNPVVAYGRVFIGNVDSYVYSFGAKTGELAWRTKTNGYVYASPTVGAAPGDKPTVYAGSYDGSFYALDARTGSVRWRFFAGGAISGGSTLLGDTIWFSDLKNRRTYMLDARTGKKRFEYGHGGYGTLITDKKMLYVMGYASMYALEPLSAARRRKIATAKREDARKARQRRQQCSRDARKRFGERRTPRRRGAFLTCVKRTHAATEPSAEYLRAFHAAQRRVKRGGEVPERFRGLIRPRKR